MQMGFEALASGIQESPGLLQHRHQIIGEFPGLRCHVESGFIIGTRGPIIICAGLQIPHEEERRETSDFIGEQLFQGRALALIIVHKAASLRQQKPWRRQIVV